MTAVPAAAFSMFMGISGMFGGTESGAPTAMRLASMDECNIYLDQQLEDMRTAGLELEHKVDKPDHQAYTFKKSKMFVSMECRELKR